jgi:hypothetical protein
MKPCTRCRRMRKGRTNPCYQCRTSVRVSTSYHEQKAFWRPCLELAAQMIVNAMKVKT